MTAANTSAMRAPGTAARARGGGNGGLQNLHPLTLPAGTVLVRFGAKSFDAVSGPGPGLRKRSSAFGEVDEPYAPPLDRGLSGSGGFAGTVASGEWWLQFGEYRKVERFADKTRIAINVAIRRLCFVPPEWSDLGMVIQARLMRPLRAFQGLGNPATGYNVDGKVLTYARRGAGAEQIRQLFIPGLASPDLRRASLLITGTGFLPTAAD